MELWFNIYEMPATPDDPSQSQPYNRLYNLKSAFFDVFADYEKDPPQLNYTSMVGDKTLHGLSSHQWHRGLWDQILIHVSTHFFVLVSLRKASSKLCFLPIFFCRFFSDFFSDLHVISFGAAAPELSDKYFKMYSAFFLISKVSWKKLSYNW